jgi:histidinol-phosphate phosphatase family protein
VNVIDQVLSDAHDENVILGALLGILLDGGRVITTGPIAEDLFNLVPDTLYFERRPFASGLLSDFADFGPRDCLFVENCSVDDLWELSQTTSAQIVHLSKRQTDESLVDYEVAESELRSAVLSLKPKFEQIKLIRDRASLDGPLQNKAIFLDRDGVVIEDTGYVREVSDVRLISNVVEGLREAREEGYFIFVVTNQSGIGRGLLQWEDYEKVTARMQTLVAEQGLYFDRILRAPFYKDSRLASGLVRKSLRKPRPGMIHQVVSEFRIDLSRSILVGDCATDLMSGALAGVEQLFLMNSVKTNEELEKWNRWPLLSRRSSHEPVKKIKSLREVFKQS